MNTTTHESDVESFFDRLGRETWRCFTGDPVLYIVGSLVVGVVGVLTLGILLGPLTVGFMDVVQKRRRGEEAGLGDIFGRMDTIITSLLALVLIALVAALGLVLLVVPGLAVLWVTMFTFPAIALRNAGLTEALRRSIDTVKAHPGNTVLLFLVLAILSAIGNSVVVATLLTTPITLIALPIAFEQLDTPSTDP